MRYLILALFLALGVPLANAEVLLLNSVKAEAATATSRPGQGDTMKSVRARFGAPATVHPTVGKPPITRWDYPDFSVYFEHQNVIHAVPRHSGERPLRTAASKP